MGKSLGITAFVLLLVSLPIPVLGNYITLLGVLILSVAAYQGEKTWVVVVDILAWVKMFFLSPTWHLMMFGGGYMQSMSQEMEGLGTVDSVSRAGMNNATREMGGINSTTLLITVLILAAPIALMIWRSKTPLVAAKSARR